MYVARKQKFRLFHATFLIIFLLLAGLSVGFGYRLLRPVSTFPQELLVSSGEPKQIGITESILKEDYATVVAAHYPKMGFLPLDRLIFDTVNNEVVYFHTEFVDYAPSKKDLRAQFYVDYQSFLTNDRFIGIVFTFEIHSPTYAHPHTFQKVINYDLLKNREVVFDDIFRPRFTQVLSSYTRNYLEGHPRYQDETGSMDFLMKTSANIENFSKLLIGNEGLHVYFDRAELLSGSKGLISYVIPYEQFEYDLLFAIIPSVIPKDPVAKPTTPKVRTIDPSLPMIALTFDDGPTNDTTRILDVLEKYEGAATFFVLGSRVNGYPNVMKRIVESGSEIGNHTWSHRMMTKLTRQEVLDEIRMTNKAIETLIGVTPTLVRPPFGMVNDLVLGALPEYRMVMWSVDTEDWRHKSGVKTLDEIKREAHDGAIILMHDLVPSTADSMEDIVRYLVYEGYQLVTVSEMLEHRPTSQQKFRELLP